jgi:hypothetical protein
MAIGRIPILTAPITSPTLAGSHLMRTLDTQLSAFLIACHTDYPQLTLAIDAQRRAVAIDASLALSPHLHPTAHDEAAMPTPYVER